MKWTFELNTLSLSVPLIRSKYATRLGLTIENIFDEFVIQSKITFESVFEISI
jgi:hypothetical protein